MRARIERKTYRIGLNPDCPVHCATLGGQVFSKHSERVTGSGVDTQRDRIDGHIVTLSADELRRCLEAAKARMIRRTFGRKASAHIVLKSKEPEKLENDLELAPFVYAVEVENSPFKPRTYPTLAAALGDESVGEPEITEPAKAAPKVSDLELREREASLRERELAWREKELELAEREAALSAPKVKAEPPVEGAPSDPAAESAEPKARRKPGPKSKADKAREKLEQAREKAKA